jgi:hypothetical protein
MLIVGPHTQAFIDGLNTKFPGDTFSAMPGRKYDRIVRVSEGSTQRMAFAFIDANGNVYKSAGWQGPAKGVRYTNVKSALIDADRFGSFLYAR